MIGLVKGCVIVRNDDAIEREGTGREREIELGEGERWVVEGGREREWCFAGEYGVFRRDKVEEQSDTHEVR